MASHHIQAHLKHICQVFPWTKPPLIIGAPMRIISGPELAVQISSAGGIGFIGPGAQPSDLTSALQQARDLIASSPKLSPHATKLLPIGIGFQTWAGNLTVAREILRHHPVAAVWLFAPRHGQTELDEWTAAIRNVAPQTQIWIQIASVRDALAAVKSEFRPDVVVVQGADACGHSLDHGAGIVTLLPEVADALSAEVEGGVPLVAAGGIVDARGAGAALVLGAVGVAMGTRLLASTEAVVNEGYQDHVVEASDGGQTTVRTQLYNHLRGTTDWPEGYGARGIANESWREHVEGVAFETLKERHDDLLKKGAEAWGENGRTATYAGTGVGLVREVKSAIEIVEEIRGGIGQALGSAVNLAQP